MTKKIIVAVAIVFCCAESVFGLSVDNAEVLDTKHLDVDVGYEYSKTDEEKYTDLGVGVTYGFYENMDCAIWLGYNADPDSEMGDPEFGLKYAFIPEILSISVWYATGDENSITGTIVASYEMEMLCLNGNIGYMKAEDSEEDEIVFGISVEKYFTDELSFGLEYLVSHVDEETSNAIGAGFAFEVSDIIFFEGEIIVDTEATDNITVACTLVLSF